MDDPDNAAPEISPPSFRSKWIMLVVCAISLLALMVFERHERYKGIEVHEMARLQTLARATEANLLLHLKAIDRLLLNVRDRQTLQPVNSAGVPAKLPGNDELRFQVETTPGMRTLAITDRKGNLLASNRTEFIGRNFAERPYFQSVRKLRDARTLVVSEPFLTALKVWGVQFARPILDASGEFQGSVMATLDPEFFHSMLSSALYAEDLRCLLVHQDGVVFQAVGDFKADLGLNLKQPGSLLSAHLDAGKEESSLIQSSYSTHDRRIAVLRNVAFEGMDKRFIVTFSRNFDQVFATWKRETWLGGAGLLVLLVSCAAWLAIYQRQQLAIYRNRRQLFQERAAAEESRQEAAREIEELYNHAPCGYHTLDAHGVVRRMNQTALDWLGLRREDVEGKLLFTDLLDADGAEDFRESHAACMEIGHFGELEFTLRRPDGSSFAVLAGATAIRADDGSYQGSRMTLTDISERKAAETELERHRQYLEELVDQRTRALAEAKERAETANRAKSLFLGNMSHEMRTPVHQISGVLGLMKNGALTDKQKHYLNLQETAVNRLNAVVGSILTLVDLESGSRAVKLSPVNPAQIVRDVVAMMSGRANAKGLRIDFVESELPAPLLGDAGNIKTIVACYCDNAITFSESGAIRVRLQLLSEAPGSIMVRLEIQDEGIGIAPEDCERVFQHFEQADDSHSRKYGGTGVGLAIARKLARLMGGDAGCESVLGVGSTFWASFVLVKASGDPDKALAAQGDFVI